MHPIRNAPILRFDGSVIRINVCIGIITKELPINHKDCMFYALVSERQEAAETLPGASAYNGEQDNDDSLASITEASMPLL